jgi:hypothetical protein
MLVLFLAVGVTIAVIVAMVVASRRFEARRRRAGSWDAHGPKTPDYGPPNEGFRAMGAQVPDLSQPFPELPPEERGTRAADTHDR